MTYVIWTPEETHAVCAGLAHAWLKYGASGVNPENYRALLKLAAEPINNDWRPRTLQARSARAFIEKHRAVLEKLMESGADRGYLVPGYDQPMTIKQMQDEIIRLNAELKALKEPPSPPPAPILPILTRPNTECDGIYRPKELAPKKRVAIAGLHDKHRDRIAKAFPHFDIKWIEPRDNDALIKSKASGRVTIACTYGTNGNVLKLLHNISVCHTVGGAHGVRETLAQI